MSRLERSCGEIVALTTQDRSVLDIVDRDWSRARKATEQRRVELGLSFPKLSARTHLAVNTIRGFVYGSSEPVATTLAALERGLEWPTGRITEIATGVDLRDIPRSVESERGTVASVGVKPTVGSQGEADDVIVIMEAGWDDGLTELEKAEILANAKAVIHRLAREMRALHVPREDVAP